MRIAIHAADLDSERIDGTRVYIHNVLAHLGKLSPQDDFLIYHKKNFNPNLAPASFPNYEIKKNRFPVFWTQIAFAFDLWKDAPDVLWMPMHNLPFVRRKSLKTVVTIHDLAFKIFPEHFPKSDLRKLNLLTDYAVKESDRIIAVSESTKRDILKFYPQIKEDKVKVIYHGFNPKVFQKEIPSDESLQFLTTYKLKPKSYLLYVGAIQPRKNLPVLIDAFDRIKKDKPELKLVIAGEKAWLWEETLEKIEKSPHKKDIVITGYASFDKLAILYRNAEAFVFPSLYEGFGIPLLEAFASGTPIVAAGNSSLREVGGDAPLYFDAKDPDQLYEKILQVLEDGALRNSMVEKGKQRAKYFSWEKCAQETADFIKD